MTTPLIKAPATKIHLTKTALIAFLLSGAPAWAQLSCILIEESCTADCDQTTVTFAIDEMQFVAPQDPYDPPRRQVTQVALNERRFTAEAIMMDGGVLGFHEDAGDVGSALMIVQPNGAARLTLQPENQTLIGTCVSDDP